MAAPTTGLAAAAAAPGCPAYPWPQDGAQRGQKVFMQSDCAACHSMLPYAGLREAARGEEAGAKSAEIVVVAEEARPPPAAPLPGGACTPDLTTLVTKVQEGLRYNLYYSTGGVIAAAPMPRVLADGAAVCQELKKKVTVPSPVWLQFVQPYMSSFQAA